MTQEEKTKRQELMPKAKFVFETLLNWGLNYVGIHTGQTHISVFAETSSSDEANRIRRYIEKYFPELDDYEVQYYNGYYRIMWSIYF